MGEGTLTPEVFKSAHVSDWSLMEGEGLQNGKIAARNFRAPPPPPPLALKSGNSLCPHSIWLKL